VGYSARSAECLIPLGLWPKACRSLTFPEFGYAVHSGLRWRCFHRIRILTRMLKDNFVRVCLAAIVLLLGIIAWALPEVLGFGKNKLGFRT